MSADISQARVTKTGHEHLFKSQPVVQLFYDSQQCYLAIGASHPQFSNDFSLVLAHNASTLH